MNSNFTKNSNRYFPMIVFTSIIMNIVFFITLIIIIFGNFVSTESADIFAAIIAAFGAVSVAIISSSLTKLREKQLSMEQEHKKSIIPIYEEFLPFWFNLFKTAKTDKDQLIEQENIEFLQKFTQKIILWGSDKVLKEFSSFRKSLISIQDSKNSQTSIVIILEFEKLLYAIREDIGHRNLGLEQGDILATFINKIDEFLSEIEKNNST